MRIGIDGRLWNETGVGRYIRNLVRQLVEIDTDNDYVLFVADPQNFQFPISNFQLKRWKVVEADVRWHTLDEQLRLPSILNKERLDLVHFPYFSVPYFYARPFVVTIHDLIPLHFDTGLASTLPIPLYKAKRLGYKFILRQTVKKAKKIIAVSNSTRQEIVRYLGVEPLKVVVTYEGIDAALKSKVKSQPIRQAQGKKSKLQLKSQKYFLYVGNAYPHKNLERLLVAFQRVILERSDRIPLGIGDPIGRSAPSRMTRDVDLIFVGKEDYFYKRLKEKVKEMGLIENVTFFGQATDEELVELYKNAKALIIPSLMEGFGLPALEAMANKCLVLASDIAALRETCGDAAIYFNPYDVEDMVTKLKALIGQSNSLDYRTKQANGIARANQFSWEKMAEETLRIYKEAASSQKLIAKS